MDNVEVWEKTSESDDASTCIPMQNIPSTSLSSTSRTPLIIPKIILNGPENTETKVSPVISSPCITPVDIPLPNISLADLSPPNVSPTELRNSQANDLLTSFPPPPTEFQSPRDSIDTQRTTSPTAEFDSSDSGPGDSSTTDSDVCCLTFLKRKNPNGHSDDIYYPNQNLETTAIQRQPTLQQVAVVRAPSPTLTEPEQARQRLIRQRRIEHYQETHGGFEMSLDPNPRSLTVARRLEVPGTRTPSSDPLGSPRSILGRWDTHSVRSDSIRRRTQSVPSLATLKENWQQNTPCSCMAPLLTPQRGQSQFTTPQGSPMRPSVPINRQPTLVHRNYIMHDPHECRICFAISLKNPVSDTRYSVQITGYPLYPSPQVTYSNIIYFCNQYEGFRALHVAAYQENTVYAEFFNLHCAGTATSGLNGFGVTERHVLRATLMPLPFNAQRIALETHL